MLTDFHTNETKNLFKKIFQTADSKKLRFSKPSILKNCFRKFQRLVLGLVGLIDAKGVVWLNLYAHEPVGRKLKNSLKTQKMPIFELTSDSLTTI